jgi:hypothetical protein
MGWMGLMAFLSANVRSLTSCPKLQGAAHGADAADLALSGLLRLSNHACGMTIF